MTATDTTTQNLATVQAIYEAFGRGDIPAVLELLHDDILWDHDDPSWGISIFEPRTGKAGVLEFFQALSQVELYLFEPQNLLAGGDQVAGVVRAGIRFPATGKSSEQLEVHLWTFGPDGRVVRFAHVIDRHPLVLAST